MKRWTILLLAAALLLSACGSQAAPPAESGESQDLRPAEAESTAPQEAEPAEPEEEPEEIIAIDPQLYSPENCRYTLLDREELRLDLIFTKDMSTGGPMILYMAENRCEEELRVDISQVLLNGSVRAGTEDTLTVPAKSVRQMTNPTGLLQSCTWIGYENLREFSASLCLTRSGEKRGESIPCSVSFPEGIRPCFRYESYREGRADRQVLRADEKVCIALLGCGRFFQDGSLDRMKGVLWIENRSEEEIPAALSGLEVNGVNLPVSARRREALPPHSSCLLEFTVGSEDFDLAGIRSVESLRLQILSSAEEDSGGGLSAAGGAWYSVALAVSGTAENSAAEGTLLYDDGLLQLSLVSAEIKESIWPDVMNAEYTLYVVNRRTDGISLYFSDPMVDDQPYESAVMKSDYFDKTNVRFGPQSEGYTVLTLDLPAETAGDSAPVFSFRLQLRSQGGDSIFYTLPERVRIDIKEDMS